MNANTREVWDLMKKGDPYAVKVNTKDDKYIVVNTAGAITLLRMSDGMTLSSDRARLQGAIGTDGYILVAIDDETQDPFLDGDNAIVIPDVTDAVTLEV